MRYCLAFLCIFLSSISYAKPDLMALETYQGQDVTGWLVSEKLDGVRAYWDGKKLISRQGNVFHAPKWFTQSLPSFELDGELWFGRNQFENTVSIVRQSEPDSRWRQITYWVFDLPTESGGLLQRLAKLENYLQNHSIDHVKVVPHFVFDKTHSLQDTLNRIVEKGGEGLVLREPNVAYQSGRTPYALKLKPKYDAECRVTGYSEGQGKYQGLVGALHCINDQGQELKLGSGLTDQQRRQPPAIGALVSYQYYGYTASGWPKHAVFWRERVDEPAQLDR